MEALVKLFGIAMVAAGAVYLAKVSTIKKVIRFWIMKKRLYLGGVLSIVIGILFLIAAPSCRAGWFIVLMGVLSIVKGILIFTPWRSKLIGLSKKLMEGTASKLRLMAIITIAVGVLVIYAA